MLYYLTYGILYTLSLLPWRVLYAVSDFAYVLLYYMWRYRKKVVMDNLLTAFPEKAAAERVKIAKSFYHSFLDTFVETLKFLSLSDKAFAKRISGNFEIFDDLYASGQNVQLHGGHFFNWEYMNWAVPRFTPYPLIGVYNRIDNPVFNKIVLKMRQRYNTILLSAADFKTTFHQLAKGRFALGLYADQTTPNIHQCFWLPFFGKLTPFVAGPEKSARINNTAVVFAHHYKVKRGSYHVDFTLVTTTPKETGRGELTRLYVKFLEESIRKKPSNYLWSHRRWKREFSEAYRKQVL